MRVFLSCAILLLLACGARAATVPVFSAPYDFALLEPQYPPPPGGPVAYATTSGTPQWSIANWNIPGGKLPPFTVSMQGTNTVFTSRAPESSVVITQTPAKTASYQLSQNGAVLPCDTGGEPRESDLFAGSYNQHTPPEKLLTLTALTNLISTATIKYQYGEATPRHVCAVSQGSALISVILNDQTKHQTFFYQLELSDECGPQPAARARMCETSRTNPKPSFFFGKNPFGADEALTLFGQKWLANNETRTIHVDLLPHLINLVENGPPEMDHDPSHWTIGAYYNGQHIWGDMTMTTTWSRVSLLATTR
jgi:hypothetical protein